MHIEGASATIYDANCTDKETMEQCCDKAPIPRTHRAFVSVKIPSEVFLHFDQPIPALESQGTLQDTRSVVRDSLKSSLALGMTLGDPLGHHL